MSRAKNCQANTHKTALSVKRSLLLSFAIAPTACVITAMSVRAVRSCDERSPIYGVKIPSGYRQWQLIAPSQEAANLNELRVILGNAVAMKAFRNRTLPLPDGAIIAKLAWKRVPSLGDDRALGSPQAFVPGAPTTVQFMVKDSQKFAATGGWGFGRFIAGKPVDKAQHETCFACHEANAQGHDLLFTHYAR